MNRIESLDKIILGSAQMGLDYGINNIQGQIDFNQSFEILKFAYLNGIKNIDCAESYGNIHSIIGMFKRDNPKYEFNIQTKLSSKSDLKLDSFGRVNKILSDLRTNKIQTLMFHSYSIYRESLDRLNDYIKMKDEGLINFIGVSVYRNSEIKSLIRDKNIDLIQIPFNMLDSSKEKVEIIKKAKLNGKIIQARSVFLQGLFFKDINDGSKVVKDLLYELNELKLISKNNKISMHEMSLNYVLHHDCIDNIIIGIDNIKQLKKNINSLKKSLSKKIINQINSIKIKNTHYINPTNWDLT